MGGKTFKSAPITGGHAILHKNTYGDSSNAGNVDFVGCSPERGFAYVADGVGHNYSHSEYEVAKKKKLESAWKEFEDEIAKENFDGKTWEQIQQWIRNWITKLNEKFEEISITSTFSAVLLVSSGKEKYVICIQIGDSGIFHIDQKSQKVASFTNHRDMKIKNTELAGSLDEMELVIHPVNSGDIVIGLTDGILDFLGKKRDPNEKEQAEAIQNIYKSVKDKEQESLDSFLDDIYEQVMQNVKEWKIAESDLDDVSAFAVIC